MHDAEMGICPISECEWPTFLYPHGTGYDLEDEREGLFRGYLLPIVCITFIYAEILICF